MLKHPQRKTDGWGSLLKFLLETLLEFLFLVLVFFYLCANNAQLVYLDHFILCRDKYPTYNLVFTTAREKT